MKFLVLIFSLTFVAINAVENDEITVIEPKRPVGSADADGKDGDTVVPNTEQPTSNKFNEQLEKIIADTIRKHRETLEPFKIAPYRNHFLRKVGFITFSGESVFNETAIAGLSTLKRSGQSSLVKTKYGNSELRVQLSIGPLNFRTVHRAALMGMRGQTELTGRLEKVDAHAVIHYHPPTQEIFLKSFKLNELNDLKVDIKAPTIVGLSNRLLTMITNASIRLWKPVIRVATERAGARIIAMAIRESEFLKDILVEVQKN